MKITSAARADALLLTVEESRIDAASAVQFRDEMRRLVAEATGRVVLDLGRVDFIDSTGLGAIVGVMKLLTSDRRLELAALTPNVAKVFRLTRIDTVIPIHVGLDDAFTGLADAT